MFNSVQFSSPVEFNVKKHEKRKCTFLFSRFIAFNVHSSIFYYRSITILSTRQLIANIDWSVVRLNLKFNFGIIDRRENEFRIMQMKRVRSFRVKYLM